MALVKDLPQGDSTRCPVTGCQMLGQSLDKLCCHLALGIEIDTPDFKPVVLLCSTR